jgi:hypothetical protein
MGVRCLLCVVHMWRCLCYILLCEYVFYTLFGMIVLSDLYIVRGQSKHFNLYMTLSSYLLFLRCFGCRCFCMLLVVLKAILVLVSLSSNLIF